MVSIDFSDSFAYLLELSGKSNKLSIKNQKVVPLTNKIILENNKIDKDALRDVLKRLLEDTRSKKVAITYSSMPTISNGYRLPYIKNEKELREVIMSKAMQTLASDDLVLDYRISKVISNEEEVLCDVVTYLVPRTVILDTMEVVREFRRKPEVYYIPQDSIFNFASRFVKEQTAIICNITKKIVTLHLVNRPDNIITRTSNIDESNSLDLLSVLEKDEVDVIDETKSQISKLIQYQAIKAIDRPIEAIYLMGELGNEENLKTIQEDFSEEIRLLSQIKLPFAMDKSIFNGYIYALSAGVKPE